MCQLEPDENADPLGTGTPRRLKPGLHTCAAHFAARRTLPIWLRLRRAVSLRLSFGAGERKNAETPRRKALLPPQNLSVSSSQRPPSPKKIFKKQPTLFYAKCSLEIGKVFAVWYSPLRGKLISFTPWQGRSSSFRPRILTRHRRP